MATAEQLLHEAQYAFHSISFGESRENRRNRRRALSLCKKIIRKYPASVEAQEAHAILRRLGEEAYVSQMPVVHQHSESHTIPSSSGPEVSTISPNGDEIVPLDWGGLVSLLMKVPKGAWVVIAFFFVFFFNFIGFFVLLPLLAIVLFTGPFRGVLQPKQRDEMNQAVIRANAWIDERLRSA